MALGDPANITVPTEKFPPASLPTIYTDGAFNLAPTSEVVKFYLFRNAPPFDGSSDFMAQPFVQVAMPTSAFLGMVYFFEQNIKELLEKKLISAELVAEAKKNAGITTSE
jgi:hypothetical protein